MPPEVEQSNWFSHLSVWLDVIVPGQPVAMTSTTMLPAALATVTAGDVPLLAALVMFRTGVV